MLLRPPAEAGLQRDIADECHDIGVLFDEAAWAMYDLTAAHIALQRLLDEAERKGITPTLVTQSTLRSINHLTAERAFDEQSNLDDLERPRTRQEFSPRRRLKDG
jgi:arginine/lysine/ornithine decarboxylase